MADLGPERLILTGSMTPRERALAISSFRGDILLMTAIALNNDFILGRIDIDSFGVIIFDEVHRVVAHGEEYGQYRYSIYYKQLVLNMLTSNEVAVLGLTIPETERTFETEMHLDTVGVTSDTASAPKTETYVTCLGLTHAVKADLWFGSQIRRVLFTGKAAIYGAIFFMSLFSSDLITSGTSTTATIGTVTLGLAHIVLMAPAAVYHG